MNDQQPPILMNLKQQMSQQPPQMMNPVQMMNQPQVINQSQILGQSQPQMLIQNIPPMMNRSYNSNTNKAWPPMDPNMKFQSNPMKLQNYPNSKLGIGRGNWKGKKMTDKRKDPRRMDIKPNASSLTGQSNSAVYIPPTLQELQHQNRLKAKKFYPKKKFNNRFAPYAPRNTTSFLIRAKKSGGIASLVSPCPVTPAVLPTPIFSPSREVLGDMAKEEWGVDGYGSMKGLIRLRSPGHDADVHEDDDDEEGGAGSSESDVEEHVEVERRLDHDLSRFEMIYPNYGVEYNNVLENRVDDQDSHIAQLEEENLTLKERLFLMERELGDLRRRLQFIERQNHIGGDAHEEVVENGSDNESDGGSDAQIVGTEDNTEMVDYAPVDDANAKVRSERLSETEVTRDICMQDMVPDGVIADKCERKDEVRNEFVSNMNMGKEECEDKKAIECCVSDEVMEKDIIVDQKMSGNLEVAVEEEELEAQETVNRCVEKVLTEKHECKNGDVETSTGTD